MARIGRAWSAVAGTLAAVMTVTSMGIPASTQSPSAPPAPSLASIVGELPSFAVPPGAEVTADARRQVPDLPIGELDIDAIGRRAGALADSMAPEDWGPGARAERLAYDPFAAFAFVRDSIGFDAYPGTLRGPLGTLAARAGNSVDRALLLQALLDRMLVPTRLVVGTLDEGAATRLVDRAFLDPTAPLPEAPLDQSETGDLAALADRARRDYARLQLALGDRLTGADGSATTTAISEVRAHVWVQMLHGTDWLDLDPSFPNADPGATLTRPVEVLTAAPVEWTQTVTIRLVAELLDGGRLTEQLVLEHTLPAALAANRDVYVTMQPAVERLGESITDTLGGSTGWRPILHVGNDPVRGDSIPIFPGEDILSGTESGPELTALRLEVAIAAPGRPPEEAMRMLLDRVPRDVRGAPTIDVAQLVPFTIHESFPVELTAIHHVQVSTGGFDARAHQVWRGAAAYFVGLMATDQTAFEELGFPDLALPLTVADETLVGTSERLVTLSEGSDPDVRAFIDRPRVFLTSVAPGTAVGTLSLATDLLVDSVRVLTRGTHPPIDAANHRVWYGVLQSALETQLMLRRVAVSGLTGGMQTGTSLAMDEPLTVLDPGEASLPASAEPALSAVLAAGRLAVVAGEPGTAVAWWTVDPADGTTRAILAPSLGGGNYVNGSTGGSRILVNDPGRVYSRSEMNKLAQDAVKSLENSKRPPPGGGCRIGGSEYTLLTCVILAVAALAFLALGIYVFYTIIFI